jgi:hypothetical protein
MIETIVLKILFFLNVHFLEILFLTCFNKIMISISMLASIQQYRL